MGTISWYTITKSPFRAVPYSTNWHGRLSPPLQSLLSGRAGADEFDLRPQTIRSTQILSRQFRQASVLNGKFDPRLIQGKDVVVGTASEGIGDQYFVPGTGKMGGAYVHIIASETCVQASRSIRMDSALSVSLCVSAIAIRQRKPMVQSAILAIASALAFIIPAALGARLVSTG